MVGNLSGQVQSRVSQKQNKSNEGLESLFPAEGSQLQGDWPNAGGNSEIKDWSRGQNIAVLSGTTGTFEESLNIKTYNKNS